MVKTAEAGMLQPPAQEALEAKGPGEAGRALPAARGSPALGLPAPELWGDTWLLF